MFDIFCKKLRCCREEDTAAFDSGVGDASEEGSEDSGSDSSEGSGDTEDAESANEVLYLKL